MRIRSINRHKKKKSTYKRRKHYCLVTEGSDSTAHLVAYTATLILLCSIPHNLPPDQGREKRGEIKGKRRQKKIKMTLPSYSPYSPLSIFPIVKWCQEKRHTGEPLLEMPGIEDGLFFQTTLHRHLFS